MFSNYSRIIRKRRRMMLIIIQSGNYFRFCSQVEQKIIPIPFVETMKIKRMQNYVTKVFL